MGTTLSGVDSSLNLKLVVSPVIRIARGTTYDFKVTEVNTGKDYFDRPTVLGKLTNDTNEEKSCYVRAIFFDKDDKAIGIIGTNLYDIMPKSVKSFEISTLFAPRPIQNGNFKKFKICAQEYYYQYKPLYYLFDLIVLIYKVVIILF